MKYLILLEDYNSTFWRMKIGGKKIKITIGDIEKYLEKEPIIEVLVDDIKDMCIHKDKTDGITLKRSDASDLSYYIIICRDLDGSYNRILDGHHRLLKAINTGVEYIKCKILDLGKAPESYKNMFK